MDSFIRVHDVSKTFATSKMTVNALSAVSFEVKENEFVSIVGPSGCGKTTLLRILAGLTSKTGGTIHVAGREASSLTAFGIVFQFPVLLPWRRVLDNILLPIDLLQLDRTKYLDKALELMKLTGISDFEAAFPWELSGGMQQRAAICRALITDPPILLMDEPFGSLDAFTRDIMNMELLRIWEEKKKTVLFVTHDIREAVYLADKVMVMTPRPAKVDRIVEIPLPRPRVLDSRDFPEFLAYTTDIRSMILSSGKAQEEIIREGSRLTPKRKRSVF